MQLLLQLRHDLVRAEIYVPWIERLIRVAVILAIAFLLSRIASRLLGQFRIRAQKTLDKRGPASNNDLEKRATTIITVLVKVVSALIWIGAIVMSLAELTFNVQPLIAGLGVAGIALGLGAQSIIKDWLGGLFLLLEDQIRIGDSVTISGLSGTVEEVNLRTTVLRAESGAVHIIPNGSITQITNQTREYAYYLFEITLAYGADITHALDIVKGAGATLAQNEHFEPMLLGPIEVMGVDRFTDRGILIRARIKTLPARQAIVGRELNLLVNNALEAAGIAVAKPA